MNIEPRRHKSSNKWSKREASPRYPRTSRVGRTGARVSLPFGGVGQNGGPFGGLVFLLPREPRPAP